MTTEAAVAKLYYLFSCGYDKEKVQAGDGGESPRRDQRFLSASSASLRVNVAQLRLRRFKEQQII